MVITVKRFGNPGTETIWFFLRALSRRYVALRNQRMRRIYVDPLLFSCLSRAQRVAPLQKRPLETDGVIANQSFFFSLPLFLISYLSTSHSLIFLTSQPLPIT